MTARAGITVRRDHGERIDLLALLLHPGYAIQTTERGRLDGLTPPEHQPSAPSHRSSKRSIRVCDATVSRYECGLGGRWSSTGDDSQGREALARTRRGRVSRPTSVVLEGGDDEASGAALSVAGRRSGA